jgi:2,4-dienoyl-CoA reductase-like NADH-dependent reductase (Old Yellow Enzyme family)
VINDKRKPLVPLAEMAGQLRLHPQDLRREVENGRLPAVQVGTKGLLFDPEIVLSILEQRARDEASALKPGGQRERS